MKKWIIALCCALIAAVIGIVAVLNNSNARIDTLNQDLHDRETEISNLEEKAAEDEKTIQDLTLQVEGLASEKDALAAENGRLTESIETMSQNLSSSQQKLQGVLYILTDGEQGNIEGVLTPFMKIFQDVSLDSPYFSAVDYVTEHKLMSAQEEEVFGVDAPATLGEMADSVYVLKNLTGTRSDAVASLLLTEKAWIGAQAEAEEAVEETITEPVEDAGTEEAPANTEETPAEAAAEEAADTIAEQIGADVVQVIGSKFVLYRKNKKDPKQLE